MTTRSTVMESTVDRIRKVPGWKCEKSGSVVKVYAPDGTFVTPIHFTPSVGGADKHVIRKCNAYGFSEDERKAKAAAKLAREARLAEGKKVDRAATKATQAARAQESIARVVGFYGPNVDVDLTWLFGKHIIPDCLMRRVTPEVADKLLTTRNLGNRPRKERTVKKVSRALKENRFLAVHEGMALDTEGNLFDAANRLRAISETGIAAPLTIFVGMAPESKEVVGQGSMRSASDVFHMAGIPDPFNVAAVVRTVHMAAKPFPAWSNFYMDNDEVIAAYRTDPDEFQNAVRQARSVIGGRKVKRLRCSPSTLGAATYLIRHATSADGKVTNPITMVNEWLDGLRTNAGLRDMDPRTALVDWFAYMAREKATTQRYEVFAMLILCWNAWLAGNRVRNLIWKTPGREFPSIAVFDPR